MRKYKERVMVGWVSNFSNVLNEAAVNGHIEHGWGRWFGLEVSKVMDLI